MKGKKYSKKRTYNEIINNNGNLEQIPNVKKLPLPKIPYIININKQLEINRINKQSKYISIDHKIIMEHIELNKINI